MSAILEIFQTNLNIVILFCYNKINLGWLLGYTKRDACTVHPFLLPKNCTNSVPIECQNIHINACFYGCLNCGKVRKYHFF